MTGNRMVDWTEEYHFFVLIMRSYSVIALNVGQKA